MGGGLTVLLLGGFMLVMFRRDLRNGENGGEHDLENRGDQGGQQATGDSRATGTGKSAGTGKKVNG
jgi:hypothetical protein